MPPADLGLTFESLYVERLALLAHEDSPLGARRAVHMKDVARERILLTEATCSYNASLRAAAARAGVELDIALESANVATLKRAVQLGMGAAVLPIGELQTPPPKTRIDGRAGARVRALRSVARVSGSDGLRVWCRRSFVRA
jgi:DNA-binding transcriptional LysR family regulator